MSKAYLASSENMTIPRMELAVDAVKLALLVRMSLNSLAVALIGLIL